MAVTIIKLNGETILDLSSINISEEEVLEFKTFINNQGEIKKGTLHKYLEEYQQLTSDLIEEGYLNIGVGPLKLGKGLFAGNPYIKEISFPQGLFDEHTVKIIDEYCFEQCSSLKIIEIPSSLTRIEEGAFQNCSSLIEIIGTEKLNYIGNVAFNNCGLTKVDLSMTSINGIYESSFSHNNIQTLVLPLEVQYINASAFEFNDMNEVYLPPSLGKIYQASFRNNPLTEIRIPTNAHVGSCAFGDCGELTTAHLGGQFIIGNGTVGEISLTSEATLILPTLRPETEYLYLDCPQPEDFDVSTIAGSIGPKLSDGYNILYGYSVTSINTVETLAGVNEQEGVFFEIPEQVNQPLVLYNPDKLSFKVLVKQINPSRVPLRSDITITNSGTHFEIDGDSTTEATYSLDAFQNCPKLQTIYVGPRVKECPYLYHSSLIKNNNVTVYFFGEKPPINIHNIFNGKSELLQIYVPQGYEEIYKEKIMGEYASCIQTHSYKITNRS